MLRRLDFLWLLNLMTRSLKNCAYFVPTAPTFFKKSLTFSNYKIKKKTSETG